MIKPISESLFRLVAIRSDGMLEEPLIHLELDDRQVCQSMVALYQKLGFRPPWIGYAAVDGNCVVGGGAFVGPPSGNRVEIAYYTSPAYQGNGYAMQTAKRLVAIARDAAPDIQLFAKTEPRANISTKILTALGFAHVGATTDEEIGEAWLWELKE